jgi:plastocyanin
MSRIAIGMATLCVALVGTVHAQEWGTLKGQVIWDADKPDQPKIVPGVNQNVCAKDKEPLEEDYIINEKNKGLKNVFVWIQPTGAAKGAPFPVDKINPKLAKPEAPTAEIDQPCCRFIPHVLGVRAGQTMVIKNSAPIAHNAKWASAENGDINPLLPAGGEFKLPKPIVLESGEISLSCSLHSWMKAHIRVFDHPYFAITDKDGNFEIKDAPAGAFNVFVHHPATGWLDGKAGRTGKPIMIKAGANDLGVFKMKPAQ